MNTVDNLVIMANQIGLFFESMPDRTQAITDMAQHIKNFWEPRMRHALLEYIDHQGGSGLNGIVLDAVRQNKALLG